MFFQLAGLHSFI